MQRNKKKNGKDRFITTCRDKQSITKGRKGKKYSITTLNHGCEKIRSNIEIDIEII